MTKDQSAAVRDEFIRCLIKAICELPDRTSPDWDPMMMLVTGEELSGLIENHWPVALADSRPVGEPEDGNDKNIFGIDTGAECLRIHNEAVGHPDHKLTRDDITHIGSASTEMMWLRARIRVLKKELAARPPVEGGGE